MSITPKTKCNFKIWTKITSFLSYSQIHIWTWDTFGPWPLFGYPSFIASKRTRERGAEDYQPSHQQTSLRISNKPWWNISCYITIIQWHWCLPDNFVTWIGSRVCLLTSYSRGTTSKILRLNKQCRQLRDKHDGKVDSFLGFDQTPCLRGLRHGNMIAISNPAWDTDLYQRSSVLRCVGISSAMASSSM
jgi:hypothetical protein